MPSPRPPRTTHLSPAAGVALLTALAALLRFPTLGAKGFWGDEISTVRLAQLPYGDMLAQVARLESTPPLYYSLAWLWSRPFGTSEVGLRSLSALVGVAAVPITYLCGRELVSRRAGLVAAALTAVNPLLIWYSQEARSYSLLTFLSAVGLHQFARALRRPGRGPLAGWAAASCLALTTHYFAVFLIVPEAVALLIARRRRAPEPRRPRAALPLAVAAVAAAGAALLPLAVHQQSFGHAAWISHTSLAARLVTVPGEFAVGFDAPPVIPLGVALTLLMALGAVLAVRRSHGTHKSGAAVALGLGAGAIGLAFVLALAGLDYLNARNSIAALIPLTIAVGAGFAAPRARVGHVAAAGVMAASVAIAVVFAGEPKFHSEDWRGAAEDIGSSSWPRAVVATPGQAGRKPLEYYLGARRTSARIRVREVDVLALPHQGSPRVDAPALAHLRQLRLHGFRLVRRLSEHDFSMWTYMAPWPVEISAATLDARVGRDARTISLAGPPRQLARSSRSRSGARRRGSM